MGSATRQSWSFTTRVTVLEALGEREAELLGQRVTAAHLLVATVWETDSMAAHVLSELGIDKNGLTELRDRVATTPDQALGMDLRSTMNAAFGYALGFGHQHVGSEHMLLAILDDRSLADSLLSADTRRLAREAVQERIDG